MWIILAAITLVLATVALEAYLRRSAQSYEKAGLVWKDLSGRVEQILRDKSYPEPAAQMGYGLAMVTGCGCFVRAMLISHYFPGLAKARAERIEAADPELGHIMDGLSKEQRTQFDMLFAHVVVYDGFANPLQGWLFRRILRRLMEPQKGSDEYVIEARAAAISVLARKGRHATT